MADGVNHRSVNYVLAHGVVFLFGIVVITAGIPIIRGVTDSNSVSQGISTALITGIGSSLVAAGVVGLALFAHDSRSKNSYTNILQQLNNLAKLLEAKVEFPEIIKRYGLIRAFSERGPNQKQEYIDRIEDANERIDIIGFGLSAFREDLGDEFDQWADHLEVRILLFDPVYPCKEHNMADLRDLEEGNNPGSIRQDVKNFRGAF